MFAQRTIRLFFSLCALLLFVLQQSANATSDTSRRDFDVIVAGGGPVGTMSAIAVAQAAKEADKSGGRDQSPFRILVVDGHPEKRTRSYNIFISQMGIANMRSFGLKAEGAPAIKTKPATKFPFNFAGKHRPISNIGKIEANGYDAIKKWNAANPNYPIELRFESTVSKLQLARKEKRHQVTIDGTQHKASHLIVADGGREVSDMLQKQNVIAQIDRGVETTSTRTKDTPIRLTYMNESFLDNENGATITVVGDALSKGHYAYAAGLMRGTTDAVAIRELFSTLLSPLASRTKQFWAKRTFRKTRLASIRQQHQIDRQSFETKGKGQANLDPRIKDTNIAARAETNRLRKIRGEDTGVKRLWGNLKSIRLRSRSKGPAQSTRHSPPAKQRASRR